MRTFGARLQPLVVAVRALNEISLGPGEEINNQSEDAGEQDQNHPDDGAVHATRLRVAGHPDEQSDVEDDKSNRNENERSTQCASRSRSGGAWISLRPQGRCTQNW